MYICKYVLYTYICACTYVGNHVRRHRDMSVCSVAEVLTYVRTYVRTYVQIKVHINASTYVLCTYIQNVHVHVHT